MHSEKLLVRPRQTALASIKRTYIAHDVQRCSHPLDSTSAARVAAIPRPSPFSPPSKRTFADAARLSKSILPGGVGGTQASMSWKMQHRQTMQNHDRVRRPTEHGTNSRGRVVICILGDRSAKKKHPSRSILKLRRVKGGQNK